MGDKKNRFGAGLVAVRLASLEHYGLDPRKVVGLGLIIATAGALVFWIVVGDVLGPATPEFELIGFVLVLYLVVSTPRRLLEARRSAQAREAVLLSVLASASLRITGSGSRTLLMMKSDDEELSRVLTESQRSVLLGYRTREAVSRLTGGLASYSAAAVLRNASELAPSTTQEGSDETMGLVAYDQLAQETTLPIFMAVCFFSPIMLLLYSLFSHLYNPLNMLQLIALQVMVLDVAFYLCSADRLPN